MNLHHAVAGVVKDVVIVGTGGQGRECLDIALAMAENGTPINVQGFLDDDPSPANEQILARRGFAIVGTFETFMKSPGTAEVCIGVGSGAVRLELDQRLRQEHIPSPVLIHPASTLGYGVLLSPGTTIWAGARLTTNIRLGRHVHVNQNVTVGHDSHLDDFVTANPLAAISGNVDVGACATVGAGAVVLQGLTIGSHAMVGAGAVVIHDVMEKSTVMGVPAK